MIKKEQAEKLGINNIIDSSNILKNDKNNFLKKIKKIAPNIVDSDNKINIKSLQDLFDITNTTSNNCGYELTFAGKGLAKAKADQDTKKELFVEKEQSKNFKDTENVLIRGDNIDVLKVLYKNYHSKIKMIYIDPPYNTKNENFIYNDNFKKNEEKLIEEFGLNDDSIDFLQNIYSTKSHSGWLSFIYPRLKLARELLSDDGVIFISIDDNEQANLKILCDEIFGEENFVGCISRGTGTTTGQDANKIGSSLDYILVYAKYDNFELYGINLEDNDKKRFSQKDDKGKFSYLQLRKTGNADRMEDRPSMYYSIDSPNGKKIYPIGPSSYKSRWRFGKDTYNKYLEDNLIIWKNNKQNVLTPYVKYYLEGRTKQVSNMWNNIDGNKKGTREVKNLFNEKNVFDNPKPMDLINRILKISTSKNDIILDFFAGSGTTAEAVIKLNAEDGKKRKFILVQIDEPIDKKKSKEAYDFCIENNFEPLISSITIERINRAGEKIKKEIFDKKDMLSDDKEIDIGYKVFSLRDMPEINYDDKQFSLLNERNNYKNSLYNMLVVTGKVLDIKIEEIKKEKIYKADNEIYILDNITKEEIEQYNNLKVNIDAFANIDLESFLNLGITDKENINIIY